jgi:hypothetical protein
MESKPLPIGTGKDQTKDSILQTELNKLNDDKLRMKEENSAYLLKHPEINTLLDEVFK